MLNGRTDTYPSDKIHNANRGNLEGLELETLDLIIYWEIFGVERLGDQPYIIDPWVLVD